MNNQRSREPIRTIKYFRGRRGQIGTTLTWFFAFTIIVFIMIIFVLLSLSLAGKKALPVLGEGFNEIKGVKGSQNLEVNDLLIGILNARVEGEKISDWIVKHRVMTGNRRVLSEEEEIELERINSEVKNKIRIKIEEIMWEKCLYYFRTLDEANEYLGNFMKVIPSRLSVSNSQYKHPEEVSSEIILFYGEDKKDNLNTLLFLGKC